jgi:diguanylate cyclase (GGDEF)-like protein/PAS domain S-box-containing protein
VKSRWLAAPALLVALTYMVVPAVSEWGSDNLNAYNASAVLSALTLGVAVIVRRPRPVTPWLLVGAALLLWVIGDVVYSLLGTTTSGGPADLAYLAAYACLVVAVLQIVRARTGHLQSDTLIDAALVGVAGLLAIWELVIEPSWGAEGSSALAQTVDAVYPVLDVVLLVLLVQLLLAPGRKLPATLWLSGGVAVVFLADIAYAVLAQTNSYWESDTWARLLDGGWLVGYALFAVAAWHPSMTELTRPTEGEVRYGNGRLFATGAVLLTVPLVSIAALHLYGHAGAETLLISTFTIVPLVVWRIARLNQSTQAALDRVARSEAYYRGMALNSSDAYVVIDADGRVLDVSDALESLVQISVDQAMGKEAMSIVHTDDRDLAEALIASARSRPGMTVTGEARTLLGGNGPAIWVELRVTDLLADPDIGGIVINAHDITDRKRAESELSHQAFHDALTGLPNRLLLRDRLTHALVSRPRIDSGISVLYCDLDGFKAVNDTLGHDAGDQVLRVVAERLQRIVRPADTVARLGGDEFVVLLDGVTQDEAETAAARMLQVLSDPVAIGGTPLVITGSIGVASVSAAEQPAADDLLRDADTAMYEAKGAGRNRSMNYHPSMRRRALSRHAIEADLSHALQRGELEAYYQPLVSLDDEHVIGFEALVRWNHPTKGLLLPGSFIELAEESGAIIPIGAWMLRTACAHAAAWQELRPDGPGLTISVNLSARQLAEVGIVDEVANALAITGLDPSLLVLELTESMLVQRPGITAERLRALKALGLELAIDDFGVGYSSLSYLQQFPFDILKIDRSFVDGISDPDSLPAIVRGLLDLANTLGLDIVAEGIEEEVQRRSLVNEGCTTGQGFLFARPMTHTDATALVLHPSSVALR